MRLRQKLTIIPSIVALLILGVALTNVSSLNLSGKDKAKKAYQSEISLLLTNKNDILPANDAQKIIKDVDFLIVKNHTVLRGEWLEKIGKNYGVPAIYIRSTNNLDDPLLRVRQKLIVPNKRGMVHIAKKDESVEDVIRFYEKFRAKRKLILAQNDWDEISTIKGDILYLKEGAKLWIPKARKSFPIVYRPVRWSRISSRYGFRRHPIRKVRTLHKGYDLVAPRGASVRASEMGVVTFAGWKGGYGNMIEIRHRKITTRYGHLSKILVKKGQKVRRKQLIGRVGSTGLSTGAHLHFEVRRNRDGKLQNPRKYLF